MHRRCISSSCRRQIFGMAVGGREQLMSKIQNLPVRSNVLAMPIVING